ncbi:hypothetical protein [Kordiimonas sp.]|uniref:hypothetical protein n=1 Tax=Kordiimonas sp. TaxID=1970157 RepID=UPI003A929FD2
MTPQPRQTEGAGAQLVLARGKLLQAIINQPGSFKHDVTLQAALMSQGAFAKFTSADHQIRRTSLNTLKAHARAVWVGGYADFDRLRRHALATLSIREAVKPNHGPVRQETIGTLKRKLLAARSENQDLRDEVLLLTFALKRALHLWQGYAARLASDADKARCRKEYNEILACFSHALTPEKALETLGSVSDF